MKPFSREALSYAVLLVILLLIAAVAVWKAIEFLSSGRLDPESGRGTVALLIWSLTLGFMLIAGAFGLWTIQFSGQAEGRRRVARFVDTMDYLHDGLLTVDRKGRVTGFNPAVRNFAPKDLGKNRQLHDVFPYLTEEDAALLLRSGEPQEVEQRLVGDNRSRIVRFRSQPSEGLSLILVSDITAMNAHRIRNRQAARLQLVGQIARGVAHDFSNLLCAIAGHASLLRRLPPGAPEAAQSVTSIAQSIEKGSSLANHLLELSRSSVAIDYPNSALEAVQAAVENLKSSLSTSWKVETDLQDLNEVTLSGIQIEQVVMNLGLLAADALASPGILRISCAAGSEGGLMKVGRNYAGVVLISATPLDSAADTEAAELLETTVEPGVILSVVRSLIEEAGGALHVLTGTHGSPLYRIALPYGSPLPAGYGRHGKESGGELARYVAGWSIVATFQGKPAWLAALERFGVAVSRSGDVASVLTAIDSTKPPDAMVLDERTLQKESKGVLRAILKLCPTAALVVLSAAPSAGLRELAGDVVIAEPDCDADSLVLALIEARSRAARRKSRSA